MQLIQTIPQILFSQFSNASSEESRQVSAPATASHKMADDLDLWVLKVKLFDPISHHGCLAIAPVTPHNNDRLVLDLDLLSKMEISLFDNSWDQIKINTVIFFL